MVRNKLFFLSLHFIPSNCMLGLKRQKKTKNKNKNKQKKKEE